MQVAEKNNGLQALQRDGLAVPGIAPFRTDTKPRAVWPEGLTHLAPSPLVLDDEPDADPYDSMRESADRDRYYSRKYGDAL
jgi:hypothetical protein